MDEQPAVAQRRRTDRFLQEFLENSEAFAFGIVTQQGYKELKDSLTRQSEKTEKRLHRWLVMGLIAFTVFGLTSSVALVGFGVLLKKQNTLTNQQSSVTDEIQKQRYNSFKDLCEDQNKRHNNVIGQIDEAVAAVPPPPARQRRARESAKPFKLILEAAVPYTKDCAGAARARVNGQVP